MLVLTARWEDYELRRHRLNERGRASVVRTVVGGGDHDVRADLYHVLVLDHESLCRNQRIGIGVRHRARSGG